MGKYMDFLLARYARPETERAQRTESLEAEGLKASQHANHGPLTEAQTVLVKSATAHKSFRDRLQGKGKLMLGGTFHTERDDAHCGCGELKKTHNGKGPCINRFDEKGKLI